MDRTTLEDLIVILDKQLDLLLAAVEEFEEEEDPEDPEEEEEEEDDISTATPVIALATRRAASA